MKKTLSILLATVFAFSLAACGTRGEQSATQAPSASASSSAAGPEGIDTSQHVVINYMTTGDIPNNDTDAVMAELNKVLTEKVNAELNIRWIEWTDYMTNYNLTLASQDGSVDLVGTASDWLDAWPNSQNGAFLPLSEELLKTYAPQTYAQVPAENWELCKFNGQIYLIPEDNYAQWINHGFMYRGDYAREAGIANGVHNWADLEKYFQYIKDSYPDVVPWDAKADASIVTQMSTGWNHSKTPNITIDGLRQEVFFGESKDNPYTVSRYFLEGAELVNFAQTMKKWNDAGFWREDVLNNTVDTREAMYAGQSGADQHHVSTWYSTVRPEMDKKQPGSDVGFFLFGEENSNVISINITHGAMAIASKSKNPERALMVYDLLRNDPEIYRLFQYGREGVDYTVDGNMLLRPDGFDNALQGISSNFWWGRNDSLELRQSNFAWDEYDKVTPIYAEMAVPYPYGQVIFDLEPISTELDTISNIYSTYMPIIVFGKSADPAAYVQEFRDALKNAGYEKAINEVESQLASVYGS
ncbi:MAG: extracellular solute-binding protein [Clostridiales bacterium]|nr:extracellular solute-binding protein [Clostridiales bacterium]